MILKGTSKKFLLLPVAISLIGHGLLISAAGLITVPFARQKGEQVITVNLEKGQEEKESIPEIQETPLAALALIEGSRTKESDQTEDTVSLDSRDDRYLVYLAIIKARIENIWSYPHQAAKKKEEGASTIKFSLDRSGKLLGSTVIKSSGHRLLDEEALRVIGKAAPYGPFPSEITFSKLHILATFEYSYL